MKIEGGCHCELVRFEADLPDGQIEVLDCDCSICSMSGYRHVIVPEAAFRQTEGRRDTSLYRFGSGQARHIFCTQCGIKSFYRPRSHPQGISINLHCIDDWRDLDIRIRRLDGGDAPGSGG